MSTSVISYHKIERNDVVDIAKGIGILAVILMHITPMPLLPSIFMPLFFFISGFFAPLKEGDFYSCLNKKTKSLLIPFYTYIILFGIIAYLFGNLNLIDEDFHFFNWLSVQRALYESLLFQPYIPWIGQFWFVGVLWQAFIIWFLLRDIIVWALKSKKNLFIYTSCCIFLYYQIIYSSPTIESKSVIFILCRSLYGFLFISFGYIYYTNIKYNKKINFFILLLYILLLIVCTHINYDADIRTMFFSSSSKFVSFFYSIFGIISYMFISELINTKTNYIKRFFIFCGKNSLHFLGSHMFFIFIIKKILPDSLLPSITSAWAGGASWGGEAGNILIYIIVSTIMCSIYVYTLRKSITFWHTL